MTRIEQRFIDLKEKNQKGFVAYITAGDPDLQATHDIALELDRRGVDVLELGVPFSDPLADGPVIQEASQRALKAGTTLARVLDLVGDLRKKTEMPIVLFTYYNPIHRYGVERFVHRAAEAGVDGVLMLDLPPEEGGDYKRVMDACGLNTIFLVTPTTREPRIQMLAAKTTGFLYYVSRTGVTGERDALSEEIGDKVGVIRKYTDAPVAVGFGISQPGQVAQVGAYADAVVVGSAIVRRIGEFGRDAHLVSKIGDFADALISPLRGDGRNG